MIEDLSYVQVKDLLESTGIKNVSESAGEVSFSCPSSEHFHGDKSPSARMNASTTLGTCHSCGARWNAITFLAWHKSIPETVARRLLEERYGGGRISASVGNLEQEVQRIMNPVVAEEEERILPAESWLETFRVDWNVGGLSPTNSIYKYMVEERKFDREILNQWEIGYDQISERITIPIFDHHGKLVGFKGRAWRDNTIPKYMIMGDYGSQTRYGFQPYKKSHYVFGLDRFSEFIMREAILVEGELNVIAMDEKGYSSTLGIAGKELSETQCDLIKTHADEVVLFLDNDKAGNEGTKKVVEMLSPYMPVKVVQDAPGDAADLDTEIIKELISNAKPSLVLRAEGKL